MKTPILWGVVLGVVVGATGFVFAGLGLHTNPTMATVFVGIAILVNVVFVIVGLRQTAHAGWGRQVINGLVLGLVGAAVIFASSWVMTVVVFPDYYDQMAMGYVEFFTRAGLSAEQIETQMQAIREVTPAQSAGSGAVGTIITSLVVAAIAGIYLRDKPA